MKKFFFKISNNIVKSILIIFIGFLFIISKQTLVKAEGEDIHKNLVDVEVTYGIDGKYKVNRSTPVNIKISNNGEDFDGEIQIQTDSFNTKQYDLYTQNLIIAKNTTKNLVIPANILNTFNVKIISKENKTIYENQFRVTSGRVGLNEVLVGVLTEDFNGLNYLSNIQLDNAKGLNVKLLPIKISEKIIGDNAKSIELLDMIIINNYDTSKLTVEQIQSIDNWIKRGGTLIIGTGDNGHKVINSINNKILKGQFSGTIKKVLRLDDEIIPIEGISMDIENITPMYFDDGNNIIIGNIVKEKGNVIVLAFDMGINKVENKELWTRIMETSIINGKIDNQYNYAIDNLVKKIRDVQLPSVKLIVILFVSYIFIIGVLIYMVLKRLNKRDYVWLLIPLISLAFTGLIYIIGSNSRISKVIANKVNIVNVSNDSAKIESYIAFLTSKKRDISVKEPNNLKMENLSAYPNMNPQDQLSKLNNKTMRVEVKYSGDETSYNFKGSSPFSPEIFKVSSTTEEISNLDHKINVINGEVSGYINNNLECNFDKILLVTPYKIWDLGKVKIGEGKEFNEKKDSIVSVKQIWELRDKIYSKQNNSKDNEDMKYEMRNLELIDCAIQNNVGGIIKQATRIENSYLVGVSDKKIDYDFLVNEKKAVEFDSTVFLFDVNLNFKDDKGNISYPFGYHQPVVLEVKDNNGYFDPNEMRISGNSQVKLSYKISNDVEITSINFKNPNGSNGGAQFKGEYKILNFSTGKFEDLNLTKELELKDINKYIKNNEFRINIIGKDEQYAAIPEFTVKGREK